MALPWARTTQFMLCKQLRKYTSEVSVVLKTIEREFLLWLPLGRDNAITARDIASLMSGQLGRRITERQVRHIASNLRRCVRKHGVIIASSPTDPCGFYKPANKAEAEDCLRQLRHRKGQMDRTYIAYGIAVKRAFPDVVVNRDGLPGLIDTAQRVG